MAWHGFSALCVWKHAVENVRTSCCDKEPTVLPTGAVFSCSLEDVTEMFAVMGFQCCQSQTESGLNSSGGRALLSALHCYDKRIRRGSRVQESLIRDGGCD